MDTNAVQRCANGNEGSRPSSSSPCNGRLVSGRAVERRFTRESCCGLLQRAVPRRRCPLDAAASGAPLRADRHRWNGARLAPNSAHVSMLARASLTRDPPLAGVSAHGAAQGPRAGIRRRQRVRDRCGARCCFCRQRLPDIALRRMRGGAGASRRGRYFKAQMIDRWWRAGWQGSCTR